MESKLKTNEVVEDIIKMAGITHKKAAYYMMISDISFSNKINGNNGAKFTYKDIKLLLGEMKNKVHYILEKYDDFR